VEPNQLIDVELIPAEVGSTVEITDVLLVASDNGNIKVGTPLVEGARIIARVVEHGRADKVVAFKYKAKTRYRRKKGHHQPYTRLAIERILTGEEEAEEPPKRRPRARRARAKAAEPAPTEGEPQEPATGEEVREDGP